MFEFNAHRLNHCLIDLSVDITLECLSTWRQPDKTLILVRNINYETGPIGCIVCKHFFIREMFKNILIFHRSRQWLRTPTNLPIWLSLRRNLSPIQPTSSFHPRTLVMEESLRSLMPPSHLPLAVFQVSRHYLGANRPDLFTFPRKKQRHTTCPVIYLLLQGQFLALSTFLLLSDLYQSRTCLSRQGFTQTLCKEHCSATINQRKGGNHTGGQSNEGTSGIDFIFHESGFLSRAVFVSGRSASRTRKRCGGQHS